MIIKWTGLRTKLNPVVYHVLRVHASLLRGKRKKDIIIFKVIIKNLHTKGEIQKLSFFELS